MEPGRAPRLVAGDFEHPLDGPEGYEATVERVLEQVFLLDCLARTEGYYPVPLHERETVERHVDLDFAALYDAPPAERLERYLDVRFERLDPARSPWHLAADVVPTAENVETLPYLVDDLAHVRTARPPTGGAAATVDPPESYGTFYRDGASGSDGEPPTAGLVFEPAESDTMERAWLGPGYPQRVNKLTLDALRRRTSGDGGSNAVSAAEFTIDVDIVCNDDSMRDESDVGRYYGLRELPSFDVSVHHGTTTAELAELLRERKDFLHYIGHVTDDGIGCTDGHLDVETLPSVNVTAFLLNACSSYAQGAALVERGSRGGVATLSRVGNAVATDVGYVFARLLNEGFTLRAALSVVHRQFLTGYRYVALGDGALTLCQSKNGMLPALRVERSGPGTFEVETLSHPDQMYKPGAVVQALADRSSANHVSPGVWTMDLSGPELDDHLAEATMPVEVDDDLRWSDEITAAEIADLLD